MRTFRVFSTLTIAVLLSSAVHGFNVYRLGGEDGNDWKVATSAEPGEYLIFDLEGGEIGRGTLSTPSTYESWEDTLAEAVDSLGGQWLRPYFLEPTVNLAQDGVRDRIKRGISDNLITSGTCYNNASQSTRSKPMFDGDPTTAAFYTANTSEDPQIRRGFYIQNSIIDLGVDFPINRVRFFPRLGTSNPKIDELLEKMGEPGLSKDELPEDDFAENFLPWFEVAAANSIHNFAANCYWQSSESPMFRRIPRGTSNVTGDPRFVILRKDTENLDVVVDIRFPTQQFQWVAFRPINPIENWEIAEFQVFGEGYIKRAVYTTAVLDFGEPMAWGKIRWKGEIDEDAKLLIRTRSGTDDDPNLYWIPSALAGELKQITREEFKRADVVQRTRTLDEEHWSFWSSPYPWASGLRDSTGEGTDWQDGTSILSPGPRRYLQVQLVFLSELKQTVRLQELEIQFARPSALGVVGEIWPLDASSTESTSFTYSVRPTFDDANEGFDRLEVFTLTRADAVNAVRVDGVDITGTYPIEILDDRFVVHLPELRGRDDTFKLIEVDFDTHVVRYGTQFQGWISNSRTSGVKQLIEPGDASVDFPGNALGVRTEDPGERLLTEVAIAPNPFTPNGDGINDEARFHFQVHEISTPRELALGIYDLSGRQVRQLRKDTVVLGLFGESPDDPAWDGRDDSGEKVAPGIYLYRLTLETDEGTQGKTGTIVVAY